MGDGQTEDLWYPYVFWKRDAVGKPTPYKPAANVSSQGLYPEEERCWPYSCRFVTGGRPNLILPPATFDFEWLDTNARRFEIAYEDCGQRHSRPSRPYLLDDLGRPGSAVGYHENLNITQRYQVIRTIEIPGKSGMDRMVNKNPGTTWYSGSL